MESIFSIGLLVGVAICLVVPGFILAAVLMFLKIKKNLQAQSDTRELFLTGVTDPAVVISAKNTAFTGGGKNRASTGVTVTYEVEVQPASWTPFKAKVDVSLPIREEDVLGERPGETGRKIWVTYDPNDQSRIAFDHYDSNHEFAMRRKAFEKLDKRDKEIRRTGVEATATILEVEDLNLTTKFEKDFTENTILRLRLEVFPKGEPSHRADAQGNFLKSGLNKYAVGKQVIVKFNPQDRSQVALVRAVESN